MRTAPATATASLAQPEVEIAILLDLDWPSGMIRCHSGLGPLVYGGNTHIGVGSMGKVSPVSDNAELSRHRIDVTLALVDDAALADASSPAAIGRDAVLTLVTLDANGRVLDGSATPLFAGVIADQVLRRGDENAVTITIASEELDASRRLSARYNDESHQRYQPGDRIFRYVAQMADRPLYWGSKTDAVPLKGVV